MTSPITTNLLFSLEADAIAGLDDGDFVDTWADEHASNDFTGSDETRPTYRTSVLNGLPVVRFGVHDLVERSGALFTGSAGSIFFVARAAPSFAYYPGVMLFALGDDLDRALSLQIGNPDRWEITQSNADTPDTARGNTDITTTAFHIFEAHSSGTAYTLRVDGVTQTLTFTSGSDTGDWFADVTGSDITFIGGTFVGDIAEVVAYDGAALSVGDRTTVYEYLEDKWLSAAAGLSVTAEVYFTPGTPTDVSPYLRRLTTNRGSNRGIGPVVRYEAGTSAAALRNTDRRFDPSNLDGPYVSGGVTQVKPMRDVRYRATWGGITYDLWRGTSDDWEVSYAQTLRYSEVVLTGTDGFKILENFERAAVAPVGAGEDSGARVHRILDSADWPAFDREIPSGDTTVQATTLEGSALAELLLVADTEIGEVYINAAGRLIFRNRNAIASDARSNSPQAVFGTAGGSELPYENVTVSYDDDQLVNLARITRVGGVEQVSEDAASQSEYLVHSHERSDLLMEADTVAKNYGEYVVYQNSEPRLRFDEISIRPWRSPDELFPQVLGREIGDMITIRLAPPGGGDVIERNCFIRGITHNVTKLKEWQTVWTLQDASRFSFLVLDNPVFGAIDSNALGF